MIVSLDGAPPQLVSAAMVCAIDIGGTNCKVAAIGSSSTMTLAEWPTASLSEAIEWIKKGGYAVAGVTGGAKNGFSRQSLNAVNGRWIKEMGERAAGSIWV